MKKIFLSLIAAMAGMSIHAQVVKVYENGSLSATYTNSSSNTVKVVFEEAPASVLLPGKFSVSATKQVQFAKSNLYWDGRAFKFEANQTDYPTSWDANHVSHFFWTTLTDYQSGNASYMPYAQSFICSSSSTSDKFWCGEDNPLTVEGTDGLYALTGGEDGEWAYLIQNRTNADNLFIMDVTVTNGETSYDGCIIIAPDDYTETLKSNYTLDEVNADGLVCLPLAGARKDSEFNYGGQMGICWSSTPESSQLGYASCIPFISNDIGLNFSTGRFYGFSLRLVRGL